MEKVFGVEQITKMKLSIMFIHSTTMMLIKVKDNINKTVTMKVIGQICRKKYNHDNKVVFNTTKTFFDVTRTTTHIFF